MTQVVIVRPWTDAHAVSGCCSGDARYGVCIERQHGEHAGPEVLAVGEVYRQLRSEAPDVDVQLVSASNTAYLLPLVYRSARARHGPWSAIRRAAAATTAGAVLVDGERVGDVGELGPQGVLEAVRARLVRA